MNLQTSFLLAGGVAVAGIVVAAAVVLTGSEPMARPVTPRLSATELEQQAPPDPAASGVIVATRQGQRYTLTPGGDRDAVYGLALPPDGVSPDGLWQAGIDCDDSGCRVAIFDMKHPNDPDMQKRVELGGSFLAGEWARDASLLAAQDEDGGLYLVDPVSGDASLLGQRVTAYAWGAGDRLVFASQDDSGARLWGLDELGRPVGLASLAGPVDRFYVSPQRDQLVFTQDSPAGWSLLGLDVAASQIEDYGHIGAIMGWSNSKAPRVAPQLAIAWSPDGNVFAVGPVSYPYSLHLVAPGSGQLVTTYYFDEGYAGELAWSPDGMRLAISTYSLDRKQHEVYVLDVAAGEAPRHLLDGCKIVWSPDGNFIAVKREPHDATGIAAIRVDTAYHWALTTHEDLFPVSWGTDADKALALSLKPVPYAIQLGK
jgi:dipeptidyl aminopeptidase/acylaminoacyl peptidase